MQLKAKNHDIIEMKKTSLYCSAQQLRSGCNAQLMVENKAISMLNQNCI